MRLATYADNGPQIGVVQGSEIWNLRRLIKAYLFETERLPNCEEIAARLVPDDMALFIRLNHGNLGPFKDALNFFQERRGQIAADPNLVRPLDAVRFMPPVLSPSKLICCGSSYREYMIELGRTPSHPRWPADVKLSFLKQPSALVGHRETIFYPGDSEQWDYENELAIIIGRPCSDIDEKDAGSCIFGYSVFNDSCVRDLPSWTGDLDSPRGKSVDCLAPCGPWIQTAAGMSKSPNELDFSTWVDGELRQHSNTSDLLYPVERMVAIAARYIRLSPGDIIATGSTKGNAHTSGKFLKIGQTVACEIEGIGRLENIVGKKSWQGNIPPR